MKGTGEIMRNKKLAATLLAAVMTVSVGFTGCGTKDKESANVDSGKNDTKTENSADKSGKVNGIMNAEGLPIVDEPYTFSLFVDGSADGKNMYMLKELEKQTKVSLDLQMFPYEIAKEKFSLAMSSGDYAEVVGGWCLSETDILNYGSDMQVFLPLDEYFEKYCPKITEILNLEGVREAMTTPDGHIYSIPYVTDAPDVDYNPYINTKWLKNVGMEIPTTTEELRAVLKAFKEKDANGNGDPNDEIPFSVDPDNRKISAMFGWFAMPVDKYGFTMQGDKLVFGANTEEYKAGVKYFNSLYKEGLIDPETFTQDLATWKAKGAQDKYGVCMMYASSDIMPYDAGTKPDWVPLPVLSSPECDKPTWLRNSYGTDVLRSQAVITDNAKNPEIICRWFDNVFTLENSLQINNGPIDTVLFKDDTKREDGLQSYRKIDTLTLPEEEQELYSWANLFPQSLPKYVPAGYKTIEDNPVYQEKDDVDRIYQPFLTEKKIPVYWVSAENSATLSDLQTSLWDYQQQTIAQWISGQSDVDKDWEGYKKQLEKLNLQKYIDLRCEAIGQTK